MKVISSEIMLPPDAAIANAEVDFPLPLCPVKRMALLLIVMHDE